MSVHYGWKADIPRRSRRTGKRTLYILSTASPGEKVIGHSHREDRFAAGGCFRDCIDESGACFRIIINHLCGERLLPSQFVWPFGIAYKASVAVTMQPRAIAAVPFRN